MLKLAFFWHMHQPDYRNKDGIMQMPWVFLHAIKDYYDMPWILSMFKTQKATFNLTPVLMEQLELYGNPTAYDLFLQLWIMHPSALGSSERDWIVKICKAGNYDTMIRPLERFAELYSKENYSEEEFIDLEMQFMLSWCGTFLRQNNTTVAQMLTKKRDYTQEDKAVLLQALGKFVGTILPYYRTMMESCKISLSTTPLTHPILPLLIDMQNAKIANPHAPIPNSPISLLEDAQLQVSEAIALYKKHFGKPPTGLWPAEGAVCEQSMAIFKAHGIEWISTDEAILFKSIGDQNRTHLFHPHQFDGITMTFRDQGLSNLIGFDYRFSNAEDATNHFIDRLKAIKSHYEDATVSVILDGENAWEYYAENGYPFFQKLYQKLEKSSSWCKTVTMDEVSQGKTYPLDHLSPGSWIRGDFTTWSGDSEKNRAWEFLFDARRIFESRIDKISPEDRQQIQRHFLELECSDWYWWYGDDHSTSFALEFDTLFRRHLIDLYRLMQTNPPADVFEPIGKHISTASFMVKPQSPIHPKIDGDNRLFFEWIGAGSIDETRLYSTMERERGPIEKILYGYDEEGNLYLSLLGNLEMFSASKCHLNIIFEESKRRYTFGLNSCMIDTPFRVRIKKQIEIKFPPLLFAGVHPLHLRLEIECGDKIVQTLPGYGALEIETSMAYQKNWFV